MVKGKRRIPEDYASKPIKGARYMMWDVLVARLPDDWYIIPQHLKAFKRELGRANEGEDLINFEEVASMLYSDLLLLKNDVDFMLQELRKFPFDVDHPFLPGPTRVHPRTKKPPDYGEDDEP